MFMYVLVGPYKVSLPNLPLYISFARKAFFSALFSKPPLVIHAIQKRPLAAASARAGPIFSERRPFLWHRPFFTP